MDVSDGTRLFFLLLIPNIDIYIWHRVYKRRPGKVVAAFLMFSNLQSLVFLSPQESFSQTAIAAMPHRETEKLK